VSRLVESARSSGCDVQGYGGELRARVYLMSFLTGLRRQELGSLTPRSFEPDAPQPTPTVRAACSKHRREDTLPMHPELVVMVREWIAGTDANDLLFPRLERKKTWLGNGWKNGGAGGHSGSPDDTDPGPDRNPINEQSPAGAGLASSAVAN
jgi:integrase